MEHTSHLKKWRLSAKLGASLVSLMLVVLPVSSQANDEGRSEHGRTATPIKHVIVLIGENRTFDHVFATYVPKSEDLVSNLLSKGIIKADGTPGKHFSKAAQFQAVAPFKTKFFISLDKDEKAPYDILPSPTLNFSPSPAT
jgi:phospholipase C